MMSPEQKQRFARALDRVAGEESVLAMLAGITSEDAPGLIDELGKSVEQGNCDAAARTAHTLKGMLSAFETDEPVSEIQPLIDAGRAENVNGIRTIAEDLLPRLNAFVDEVRAIS